MNMYSALLKIGLRLILSFLFESIKTTSDISAINKKIGANPLNQDGIRFVKNAINPIFLFILALFNFDFEITYCIGLCIFL